jgi:hypothetical protein
MLFHLCNLGPGLFEKDCPHDNAAVLTVTFANSPSDCSKFRAAFVGIPGKCWHYPAGKMLALPRWQRHSRKMLALPALHYPRWHSRKMLALPRWENAGTTPLAAAFQENAGTTRWEMLALPPRWEMLALPPHYPAGALPPHYPSLFREPFVASPV